MKKKQPINPLPGKRLKQLLGETGTTQKTLSEKIYLSQQTISQIVTGAASLTPENAKKIIDLFPYYSYEWLLGLTDYKNQRERNAAIINQARHEGALLEAGLSFLASLSGFEITGPVGRLPDTCQVQEVLKEFGKGYLITNKDGEKCQLTLDEMNQLENDVCDYVEYRLNRWMKKGR